MNMQHHSPHFHAYYQDDIAVFSIEPVEILAGEMPRRQIRLVEAWAELHQQELIEVWTHMQTGEPAHTIEPLR